MPDFPIHSDPLLAHMIVFLNTPAFIIICQLLGSGNWKRKTSFFLCVIAGCYLFKHISTFYTKASNFKTTIINLNENGGKNLTRLDAFYLALYGCFENVHELSHANKFTGLTYSSVRFSRSIDLVSTSPLLRKYSKIIPGGWYRSKNLFNFILIFL